jgi:hypothetical protein
MYVYVIMNKFYGYINIQSLNLILEISGLSEDSKGWRYKEVKKGRWRLRG